jgi:hypothetical protein
VRLKLKGTDWQDEILREFMGNGARFLSVIAGRRAGKTYTCRACLISAAIQRANTQSWYIAPNYSQAKEQFEGIRDLEALAPFIKSSRQQPYPLIRFVTGSTIGFRSFERPKALRGSGLDNVWIDEVQDIDGDQFWPVVRPLVSDRRGKIVISGQHRGESSWYYESMFRPGMDGKRGYRSWQIPSWRGMVYQSEAGQDELRQAKTQVPRVVWEQEYECVPVANQNAVFRPQDVKAAVRENSVHSHLIEGHSYCMGIDIGRVVDRCGIVVYDLTDGEFCYSELRPKGEEHERTAKRVEDLWKDFGRCFSVIDATGGGTGGHKRIDEFTRYYTERIPELNEYIWNHSNKEQAVQATSLGFEQGRIKIAGGQDKLVKQLMAYEYMYKGGRFQYQGPSGHDDDLVAALCMLWHQIVKGRVRTGAYQSLSSVI